MLLTFVAIRLVPAIRWRCGSASTTSRPSGLAYLRHELGLDEPVWKQFLDDVGKLLHGDFGVSLANEQ